MLVTVVETKIKQTIIIKLKQIKKCCLHFGWLYKLIDFISYRLFHSLKETIFFNLKGTLSISLVYMKLHPLTVHSVISPLMSESKIEGQILACVVLHWSLRIKYKVSEASEVSGVNLTHPLSPQKFNNFNFYTES